MAILVLLALAAASRPARCANVLLVTDWSSLNSNESARRTTFQGWGHTVTTINDGASQASFDAAVATADVVYVPGTIDDHQLLYKLRTAACGVVTETPGLDTEFGFATSDGYTESASQVLNLNNSHAVTAGLSSGTVTLFSSNQSMAPNGNTLAAGMSKIGERNSGMLALGVIDAGGALANSNNGNSTASGPRVRLPWANISWSALNSNGLQIVQQAIAWAAGGGEELLLHWKLDESSGTVAGDSSDHARHGTVYGATTWTTAPRNGGLDLKPVSNVQVNGLLGQPTSFTVAGWVRLDAIDAQGAEFISLGDHVVLRLDEHSGNGVGIYFYYSPYWEKINTGIYIAGTSWRHLAATFDDDANTLKIYIDGQLAASKSTTHSIAWTGLGASTVVGSHGNGSTSWDMDGVVDDIRVYNYALSDAEVAEVHGLIAHWKLDESSGTTADDASLAENDAALTGTQGWTVGLDDNGHDFAYGNGEEYFTAPSNDALDDVQEDDYTVMAFFKPYSVPPGSAPDHDCAYAIVMKSGWHMGLIYDDSGEFHIDHWLDGEVWGGTGTWGQSYAPGRFYHVAGVISRTEGTAKIYIDGELHTTETFTPGTDALELSDTRWRIGIAEPGGSDWGYPCDGTIDDARIYNRALADEEIAKIAKMGFRAHWRFDESSGSTIADDTGNGNDAAFQTGTPSWVAAARDNGLEFNGANSADTDASFQPPAIGSVAFWFRNNEVPASTQRLFGINDSWEVRYTNSAKLSFDFGSGITYQTTDAHNDVGQWTHCVFLYNSLTGDYSLYLNGELTGSGTKTLTAPAAGTLTFGTRTGYGPNYNGALDDLRVYSYELSGPEIAELYGLIGHWKFDEAAGATIADASLMENDAAFSTGSPAWVEGVRGGALEFDGASTAVTAANVDPPNEGTVAVWIRSDGPPAVRQRAWGVGSDFEMWQDPDALMSCDVGTDGEDSGIITSIPIDDAGTWYHLAAAYDADDDSYELYLNGELHKSGVSTLAMEDEAANLLTFGTRTGSTDYFTGAIDDFRVYNRKLSQQEIYKIYGLVAWYKLDETSGTVAADSTGLGNDGDYVGSPTLGVASNGGPGMGTAAGFDGTNYVEVPKLVTDSSSASIAGWARLDAADVYGGEIASIGDYLILRVDDIDETGSVAAYFDGSWWVFSASAVQQEKTGWHHYAAVLKANDTITLYIDGNEVASTSAPASAVYSGLGSTTAIGKHANGGSQFDFAGRIDDVRIYNRGMTPGEVFDLYRGSRIDGIKILKWVETR